jgi:hypothetical protein
VLHPYLRARSIKKPEDAELYFIPIYTGRFYHAHLISGLNHQDSLNLTATLVKDALNWVKSNYPFWNKTDGLNHFMIAPMDQGRCHSLAGLSASDFGNMFVISASGDHKQLDFESQSWHCYRPGRDIVMPHPTETNYTIADVIQPHSTERNINVLYRFSGGGRGKYGTLRQKLLDFHETDPIPKSLSGWQTVDATHEDMRHSIFCVCPPGIAQHTMRVWRSIIFGCIPVTFFDSHDAPYQHFLNYAYPRFSVNVNPWELHLLRPTLVGLLARPAQIRSMQAELGKVQRSYVWDKKNEEGVFAAIYQELSMHPSRLLEL